MTLLDSATRRPPTTTAGRRLPIVLLIAFSLSLVHTIYAAIAGLAAPDFTVSTPTTWLFYALGFGSVGLARLEARWAQRAVLCYLAVVLGVALFYYPTTFEPRQQTAFGWFENDVYTGLLMLAAYLTIERLDFYAHGREPCHGSAWPMS